MIVGESLKELQALKRRSGHPLIHQIHKERRISKRTLFYVKEYGPHSNVALTIFKESLKILLLSALLSTLGGFALEKVKLIFITIVPLVILLPTLNDLVGDYGTIVSARISTLLHEGLLGKHWWKNKEVRILYLQLLVVASLTSLLSVFISLLLSLSLNYKLSLALALKIAAVVVFDGLFLVSLIFLVVVSSGIYLFKNQEDPNNFLIPVSTSVADLANMVVLAVLVLTLF